MSFAPNYKEMWLNYLDRQVENPDNTLLLYLENGIIIGFVLFGITNDGAKPYGIIFDLSVDPHTGESVSDRNSCKERRKVSETKEYRIVTSNRASTTILLINSSSITVSNRYPIFSG